MEKISKPVLHNFYRSSASWRVRIALEYKQIEYEYKSVSLQKKEQVNNKNKIIIEKTIIF